jgi:uncharacterized membrane protein YbaN (DUF454 family)
MRYLWVTLGGISLVLGILGIFLPLLPTTPFFLLTVFFFSKGSEKFHSWFISTKMYKNYIENYHPDKPVSLRKKIEIVCSVLIVVSISFYLIESTSIRVILALVFIGHLIYFGFFMKTKKEE